MALVIAPTDGYNSFISVVDADTYVQDMGLNGWPTELAEKETLLRRATQYITLHYAPHDEHIDPVHDNIKAATVEAALRNDELWSDVDAQAVTEETIGPLTTKYAAVVNGGQKRFAVIDGLMKGLGSRSVNTIKLVRA